jgi:putative copper export protein
MAGAGAEARARRAAVFLGIALAFTLAVRGAAWIWPAHVAKIENRSRRR